jgi:exo-1,4-beta-D-glucosaminidase
VQCREPGEFLIRQVAHRDHQVPVLADQVDVPGPAAGELQVVAAGRGTASGQELSGDNELQSSIWQDNDITLFPGESQTLTVTWNSADLHGAAAVVSISGWNLTKVDIVA